MIRDLLTNAGRLNLERLTLAWHAPRAGARSADLATRPTAGPLRDSPTDAGVITWHNGTSFCQGALPDLLGGYPVATTTWTGRRGPGVRLGSDRTWAILSGCRNFGKPLMHLAGISAESRPNSQPQRQIKNPKLFSA